MGQCEGAFTYGVGMHLLEEIKYDPVTGENFTGDILVILLDTHWQS